MKPKNAPDGWRRLHPLSPLLRGGIVLLVIAGFVVANFRDSLVEFFFANRVSGSGSSEYEGSGDIVDLYDYLVEEGLILAAAAILLGVVVLIVLLSWIAWRFATFRLTAEAVEERRGVLVRKHRRAPLERIQSVNLQRPFLARIFGMTKIEVVTAGQGGTVDLAYLGHRDAKAVRQQILDRARESRSIAPAVDHAGRPYGERPDTLSTRVHDFGDFDIDPEAAASQRLVSVPVGRLVASLALSWEAVLLVLIIVGVLVGGAFLGPAFLATLIPAFIAFATYLFSQFNKGFNFVLSRSDDSFRIGAGLTSTLTDTIPFGRIHAVQAQQPLLWRPLGWWRVRITTAGHSVMQGGQNSVQNMVLPVGSADDVLRVFATLLPGLAETDDDIAELRNGLTGPGRGYRRPGRGAWAVLLFGRRRAGLAIAAEAEAPADATLRVRRGALTRTLIVMPIVRAQSVQLRRPLVHRALGLATIDAHTVLGPIIVRMRGLGLGAARAIFDELAAAVLVAQAADGEVDAAAGAAAAAVVDGIADGRPPTGPCDGREEEEQQ